MTQHKNSQSLLGGVNKVLLVIKNIRGEKLWKMDFGTLTMMQIQVVLL